MTTKNDKQKLRTRYLIQPRFQILYSCMLVLIALICAIFVGAVIYLLIYSNNLIFVKYQLHTTPEYLNLLMKQNKLVLFAWVGSFVCVAIVLFIAGIFLSHRMAGPIYALMREMKKLLKGDLSAHLQFRKGDEFKNLKIPFNHWVDKLRKENSNDIEKMTRIKESLLKLISSLESKNGDPSEIESLKATLDNLDQMLAEKSN